MANPVRKGGSTIKTTTRDTLQDDIYHPVGPMVDEAAKIIAPLWPIRTFIARNPLMGLDDRPFHEAVQQGFELLGRRGYLSEYQFREFYQSGRITDDDLDRALEVWHHRQSQELGREASTPRLITMGLREWMRRLFLTLSDQYVPVSYSSFLGSPQGTNRDSATGHNQHLAGDNDNVLWSVLVDKLSRTSSFSLDMAKENAADDFLHHFAEQKWDAVFSQIIEDDVHQIGPKMTLGEWCDSLLNTDTVEQINAQLIKWCAAFLDEGQAAWPMPGREKGLYQTWKELATRDLWGRIFGIRDFSQKIQQLPDDAEKALLALLTQLGIAREHWTAYLSRHLGQLPGWASFIKWRAAQSDYIWQTKYPANLVEYLAIRLFYEAVLVETVCAQTWGIKGSLPDITTYFHKHRAEYYVRRENRREGTAWLASPSLKRLLAKHCEGTDRRRQKTPEKEWQFLASGIYRERLIYDQFRQVEHVFRVVKDLHLEFDQVKKLSTSDLSELLWWIKLFNDEARAQIWLEAFEEHFRHKLLQRLSATPKPVQRLQTDRPIAHIVFCIDVRSEGFRRHLEEMGPYETLGTAGFFGVPIRFRPFSEHEERHLYPPLLSSNTLIVEEAQPGQFKSIKRHMSFFWAKQWLEHLIAVLKYNLMAPFTFIEASGWTWGVKAVSKTLWPRASGQVRGWLGERLDPPVKTFLSLGHGSRGRDPIHSAQGMPQGFSLEAQAQMVRNALSVMGITRNFSRLVLFMGHGSHSENNPYASALNCGAVGGHHGGANARALATMANNPDVRRLLGQQGLMIPDDTLFLAGEHNTTTDEVTLYDQDAVPHSHRQEFIQLRQALHQAGVQNARERCLTLPGALCRPDGSRAVQTVQYRSENWAETQPEWGLAGNAAMIIGRRALTEDINLDGRVFLQSYDFEEDAEGQSLEAIMTGPMIVAYWINMEYYFSTCHNPGYGSGSKVTQNVVGLIGVMQGSQSDLQTGLPRQSVMDGAQLRHEPMRLLVIIESPPSRIVAVLERQASVARLVVNEWIYVVARDPGDGTYWRIRSSGQYEKLNVEALEITR
ncbi:DUF2309 domain-containing protein [Sulfobacillus thermosulfidooxidans]|uniref:DUF2309 domain-containing protein n=1 Tax=Sulfobacillus thermosulfidooxidans TaxID=28034 RepID=UPI0014944A10|nr:DUF2309 domain-containing protein [Sulfobacillus thermosulfidooxidans]